MAHQLRGAGLSIEPAIGPGASGEFDAFCTVYEGLPDLELILLGTSQATFPTEASARYAAVLGLTVRMHSAEQGVHALSWLIRHASAEWVQFFATDLFRMMRERGQFGELARLMNTNPALKDFVHNMRDLVFSV